MESELGTHWDRFRQPRGRYRSGAVDRHQPGAALLIGFNRTDHLDRPAGKHRGASGSRDVPRTARDDSNECPQVSQAAWEKSPPTDSGCVRADTQEIQAVVRNPQVDSESLFLWLPHTSLRSASHTATNVPEHGFHPKRIYLPSPV